MFYAGFVLQFIDYTVWKSFDDDIRLFRLCSIHEAVYSSTDMQNMGAGIAILSKSISFVLT